MSTRTPTFRLRGEWTAATLREAQQLASASRQEQEDLADSLADVAASLERAWSRFLTRMRTMGVRSDEAAETANDAASAARGGLEAVQALLSLVQDADPLSREKIDEIEAVLLKVAREAVAVTRNATAPIPAIDPEKLRRSMEQMARNEGENVADLLARVQAGQEP